MNTSLKRTFLILVMALALALSLPGGGMQAEQTVDTKGALFQKSYDPSTLKPGTVLQQQPYVVVCPFEPEDGKTQVMEYVGKGMPDIRGKIEDANYWKVRNVNVQTGIPILYDKYLRMIPQSKCERPQGDPGVDFGTTYPKDIVWAMGDPRNPVLKPDWNPQRETEDYSGFPDVGDLNDFAVHIRALKDLGIVKGDEKGQFQPIEPVTRAAFAKMMVDAFKLPMEEGSNPFTDVADHWAKEWILAGVRSGIIKGVSDTVFDPDAMVRREEAATMIWRYLKSRSFVDKSGSVTLHGTRDDSLPYEEGYLIARFVSADWIMPDVTDAWAVEGVKNIVAYGLYGADVAKYKDQGYVYRPLMPMTREQAAALIHLTLKQL